MQQDARTAPDTDLEAYGDWVTVDAAAAPASPTRRPPAAARDTEVAGELTGAEEEFLGRLSDAHHTAPAPGPASARETGTLPDRAATPGGVTSALDPTAPASPDPGSEAVVPSADRNALADSGVAVEPELPSAPVTAAQADVPREPDMPEPRKLPADPDAVAHTDAPSESARSLRDMEDDENGARGPARRPSFSDQASEAPETWSENAGRQPTPVPRLSSSSTSPSDRVASVPADVCAALKEQVASLAASVADVAAQVARLQTRSKPSPAETVPAPGHVAVTLEELADDEPAIVVDTGVSADSATTEARDDEAHEDRVPAMPAIRLEPIPASEHAAADQHEAGRPELVHDDTAGEEPESDTFREDVRRVLACLDQLLDSLPPEKIREFAQSPDFATYKKLFTELDLDE